MQRIQPGRADMKRGNTQPGGAGRNLKSLFFGIILF